MVNFWNWKEKIDIVKKYQDGDSSVKLAKEYNITRHGILKILKVRKVKIRNGK